MDWATPNHTLVYAISSTMLGLAGTLDPLWKMAEFITALANPFNYVGGVTFHPSLDIKDLSGKIILVTGGNTGLGKETILQLAKHKPSKIFMGSRSGLKAAEAINSIKSSLPDDVEIIWLPLDLTITDSILKAAEQFKTQCQRLDILILNAGVMALPPGETELGHEIQFGTNHTGHFLLTKLLLPTLLKVAEEPNSDVRVVTLSSVGHNFAPSFDMILNQEKLKRLNPNTRYGASKAANILFAAELARRYPSITSVSVHPGMVLTNLWDSTPLVSSAVGISLRSFGSNIAQGAYNELWAAAGAKKEDLVNGAYYLPVGHLKPCNKYTRSKEMGDQLWEWTEAELRKKGVEPRL